MVKYLIKILFYFILAYIETMRRAWYLTKTLLKMWWLKYPSDVILEILSDEKESIFKDWSIYLDALFNLEGYEKEWTFHYLEYVNNLNLNYYNF